MRLARSIFPLTLFCLPLAAQTATSPPQRVWVTTATTGFASNFQLTLGGVFGEGPAYQNKIQTGVANTFVRGDQLFLWGFDSFDVPTHINDWQVGVGYKIPILKLRNQLLMAGSGFQHWQFPNVKTGTRDWLIPGNLTYGTRFGKVPFTAMADSWTLLSSSLPKGSLIYLQGWFQHNLYKHDEMELALRHGPAGTYSWNFYGTQGYRVFRYSIMGVFTYKALTVEGGYRKQWAQQPHILNNNYWTIAIARTFSKKL